MLAHVQHQCATLHQRSCALLDDLASLSPLELNFKPSPRSWSILEVVQHLVLSEQYVIAPLRYADAPPLRRRDLRGYFGYPMVFMVLFYGVPFPTPTRAIIPNGRTTLAEMRAQWSDVHHWLQSYVDSLTPETINYPAFYHPLTGAITAKQTLALAQVHLTCHSRQIQQIKRFAQIPSTSATARI